ncbi:CHAP domain-containing protein [Myxococcus landrumensis]|uniref:CHAP domain-containing protein n=1 Tax=Myxococcus landrumensis TaxID=2813577 RepID=A0ABX7NGR9_9BACT|nr:CHAP domain-containing protein [Myxococcus landrumus]QSQ17646.1 CHAP domain-containing protein [Myxococcus landrumus]
MSNGVSFPKFNTHILSLNTTGPGAIAGSPPKQDPANLTKPLWGFSMADLFEGSAPKTTSTSKAKPPASGGDIGQKIVDIANKQEGYKEGANNSNKFTQAMTGKKGQAWCADFVSWAAKEAGLKSPRSSTVGGIVNQLKEQGTWKNKKNPQPGDAIAFNSPSTRRWDDHVGIISKVNYKTVEKNGKKTKVPVSVDVISGNSGKNTDGVSTRKKVPLNDPSIIGWGSMAKPKKK